METLKFRITKIKKVAIDISINNLRKYPVHEHYLFEEEKSILKYEYNPCSNLNTMEYKKYLQKHLENKYNSNNTKAHVKIIED